MNYLFPIQRKSRNQFFALIVAKEPYQKCCSGILLFKVHLVVVVGIYNFINNFTYPVNLFLFFWGIRMAFMCKTLSNTAPFQNVYCYSVVRLLNRLFCIAPFEMLAVERCPSPAVMWSIPNTSLMAWQRRRWSRPSRRARWVTRKRRWKSTWWKRPIPKYIDVFFYDS